MIEKLKKFSNTFRKFEEYLKKFENKDYEFDAEEIYCDDFSSMKMPEQFLVGCLMEFLGENRISISINSSIAESVIFYLDSKRNATVHPNRTSAFQKAFELLEGKYEN